MLKKGIAVFLFTFLLIACGKSGGPQDAGVTLNHIEQSADIVTDKGSTEAKAGDRVPPGARVVARGGSVDIGVDPGRAARLTDGSSVEISAGKTETGERDVEFKLDAGTLLVNLKSAQAGPMRFRVSTPSGVCGARGTGFFVKHGEGAMAVGVENGVVTLHGAAGGEVSIPAGHRAVATLTAPVTDIQNLLDSERAMLRQVNFMNFDVVIGAAKKIVAAVDVKSIESGLEMYRASNGQYPERLEDAMEASKDPWGNPFNYIPNNARDNYQLSSSGPDGQVNTSDDIRLK